MKSNRSIYTLEQVCSRIYSGGTPSTSHPEYWGGTINWLSSGETGQKYITKTNKKITELIYIKVILAYYLIVKI